MVCCVWMVRGRSRTRLWVGAFVGVRGDVRGGAFQHVGFGAPMTISRGRCSPRVPMGRRCGSVRTTGTAQDTVVGANWLGSPHRYRIDWNAGDVMYSIDGVEVLTHVASFSASLRPIASDFSADGVGLTVDWLEMSPYDASCAFESACVGRGRECRLGGAHVGGRCPDGHGRVVRDPHVGGWFGVGRRSSRRTVPRSTVRTAGSCSIGPR